MIRLQCIRAGWSRYEYGRIIICGRAVGLLFYRALTLYIIPTWACEKRTRLFLLFERGNWMCCFPSMAQPASPVIWPLMLPILPPPPLRIRLETAKSSIYEGSAGFYFRSASDGNIWKTVCFCATLHLCSKSAKNEIGAILGMDSHTTASAPLFQRQLVRPPFRKCQTCDITCMVIRSPVWW